MDQTGEVDTAGKSVLTAIVVADKKRRGAK